MKTIPLSQGKSALVDTDIHELISDLKWTCRKHRDGRLFYAYRNVRMPDGKLKHTQLHHVVIGSPIRPGFVVDHINGDGLDNRRCNLKVTTSGKNICNSTARRLGRTHSQYPGVTWHKGKKRWYTSHAENGKSYFIGTFLDEKEAAIAHDRFLLTRANQNV